MLSDTQLEILGKSKLELLSENPKRIEEIARKTKVNDLTDDELIGFLKICNALYRSGELLISDKAYDTVFLAELEKGIPATLTSKQSNRKKHLPVKR